MTYSSDLRQKVLEKLEQGYSIRQTAELFGIHFTTVRNWKKQPLPTTPKPPQVRPPKKISKEALLADVEAYPTDYLYERAARFGCTAPSIRQALIRYGISRKKNRLKHPKADPERRKCFLRLQERYRRRGKDLVYLDESGFRRDWVRNYGYAAKGKPCVVEHDWHGKNQVNAIGAWHKDKYLFAVGLFERGINSTVFQTWVEKVLLPQLPCNSVVVMDNASFHKRAALIRLLEEKGHTVLWLPPYSPDFNPIEKVWAWMKSLRNKWRVNDIEQLFSTCMNY